MTVQPSVCRTQSEPKLFLTHRLIYLLCLFFSFEDSNSNGYTDSMASMANPYRQMDMRAEFGSTELLHKSRKNKEDKYCGVCGDRALGYNFDAISCESCKAFFRRNAPKGLVGLFYIGIWLMCFSTGFTMYFLVKLAELFFAKISNKLCFNVDDIYQSAFVHCFTEISNKLCFNVDDIYQSAFVHCFTEPPFIELCCW